MFIEAFDTKHKTSHYINTNLISVITIMASRVVASLEGLNYEIRVSDYNKLIGKGFTDD